MACKVSLQVLLQMFHEIEASSASQVDGLWVALAWRCVWGHCRVGKIRLSGRSRDDWHTEGTGHRIQDLHVEAIPLGV